MSIRTDYTHTIRACCTAYVIQAAAVNYTPLLYLKFMTDYSISLAQISTLIIVTFVIQILVDLFSTNFIDKIGYRVCAGLAHVMAAAGFIMLGFFPDMFSDPYVGILTACFFYSFGSGLIEVLVSPVVQACPTDNKEASLAFLHSFYCWGCVFVIVLSTLFFKFFGLSNWKIMTCIWAILPVVNGIIFMIVPMPSMEDICGEGGGVSLRELIKRRIIWAIILLMFASGASELAMSQWASAFAENGLKVSKTVGDLAGPCMFAITMGTGRIVYSKLIKHIGFLEYMIGSSVLCIISYLLAALSTNPIIALAGCALTGLSVGVFWPGSLSFATKKCPDGGTAMFGLLAFAGDSGCTLGPSGVGFVAGIFGDNLKSGLVFAIAFPLILLFTGIFLLIKDKKDKKLKI